MEEFLGSRSNIGAQWRDIPERYGPCQTVYDRFVRWRRKEGAVEVPDDHGLGRSRGGFGTKVHLVTDANGLPPAAMLSPGQRQELPFAIAALEAASFARDVHRI
ncbi:putative transposase of IS4/5 family DUF4096 [Azospirillum brasilense]|uniref:Putative transposase of IS4/5 family DUF4096 n=1 Tax=Azospirillum brasilense TaxID=192 RepID=A0A560BCE3_AZOBR|nr:putative transposase of IS4/5 family DUF4096 [Azospirillum brasilense]